MKTDYAATGIRQTVKGVMVTNCHNHPHVLLLKNKKGASPSDGLLFQLPGEAGRIRSDGASAINRTFNKLFSRTPKPRPWEFPYQPAHCTKPVELTRWLLVNLPDEWEGAEWEFFVPENFELVNKGEYGPQISTLPHQLGRFTMHTA
eukprot:gene15031-35102_t